MMLAEALTLATLGPTIGATVGAFVAGLIRKRGATQDEVRAIVREESAPLVARIEALEAATAFSVRPALPARGIGK